MLEFEHFVALEAHRFGSVLDGLPKEGIHLRLRAPGGCVVKDYEYTLTINV